MNITPSWAGLNSQGFSYQGRITNSTGTSPLTEPVILTLGIYDPSGSCLLYEEVQPEIDLSISSGFFSVQVGSPLGALKRTPNDPGLTLAQIFSNTGEPLRALDSSDCNPGYIPQSGDQKKLRVNVNILSTGEQITLTPDLAIESVPQATTAESLQGIAPHQLIQITGTHSSYSIPKSSLDLILGGTNSDASSLHNHDSLYISKGSTTAGSFSLGEGGIFGFGTRTTDPVHLGPEDVGKSWYDSTSGQIKFWDGTQVRALQTGSSGSTGTEGITGLTGDVTTSDSSGVASTTITAIGGVSASTVATQVQSVQNATSANTGGTLVKRDSSGNFSAGTVTLSSATLPALPAYPSNATDAATKGYVDWILSEKLGTELDSGRIFVGNSLKVATAVTISGDATLSHSGVLTLKNTGSAGTYTKVTTDAQGRVSSGTTLSAEDIPSLSWNKINLDKPTSLSGYGISDSVHNTGDTMTGSLTISPTTDSIVQIIKGTSNQTSDLTQWKNSTGTILTKIDNSGKLTSSELAITGGTPGAGKVLTSDASGNATWQNPTTSGTITSVTAGTGLTGGTITGTGTLAVDVGTSANKIVQLDATAKLPSVDASLLTSLNASNISSGTINASRLPASSSTSTGALSSTDWNTFNNKLGTSLTSGQIFVGNATNTATGVAMSGDATLSNTGVLTLKNTGTAGTYAKVTTDAQGRVTAGSALSSSDIPSLDASKVTTGTFTSSQIPALDWSKITSGKPTTISGYGITDAASLASPALTGTPTAPTAAANTNTTQIATTAFVLGQASSTSPAMNGTAAVGTGTTFARGDHVHPTDSSRAPAASPTFTGSVTLPGTGTWNSSGNVGIGTTSPGSRLQVSDTNTATSGTNYIVQITPTYNQTTSTAANTDLLINRTQTSVGSGTQNLIDAQVGGVSQFSVSNAGTVTAAGLKVTGGTPASGKVLTSDASGNASWQTPATSGGTVTNVTGTAPISVATGTTTPAISIATANSTTAGALSSTDWSTFNNKESALTFSAPFSRTTNTVSIPAASSVSNGYLSSSDWLTFNNKMGSALTSGQIFVGNATNTATGVAMSGDATLSNTGALTLKNTGTAGTYAKVTTDAQGRVTAGSALSSSDIPSLDASKVTTGTFTSSQIPALDWSKITSGKPTTLSGYGITDLIVSNGGNTPSIETGLDGLKSAAGTAGRLYIAKDTFKIYRDNGTSWDVIASQSGSGGTVTSVTGSGPISVATGTSTPAISIATANSTTAGALSSTDWSTFNNKESALTFSAPFSRTTNTVSMPAASSVSNGYLSSSDWLTFNNKMSSSLLSGQIFVGNATNTATGVAMSGDATLSNTGVLTLKNTGTAGTYAKVTTDAQGRVTAGSALSSSDIPSLDASKVTTGTFTSSQIPALDWSKITSGKPTTISGYGITDAASLASPALTGTPTAPTAAANTNTTQIATTAFVLGQASSTSPAMNGTAAVGTGTTFARGDHVHPTDSSRAPAASPTFTGSVTLPGTGTWNSSGNVGIGTTSPGSRLQVSDTNTATSGTNYIVQITPTYNQTTSTAANTDLLINRTQTSVGSGTQNLIDAQVGGVSQFSVSNAGTVTAAGLKVTGGTPASGKVLTSDASGNASWQTPATSGGTVTNVTGTAPISVATGTTTPAISIATANSTTAGALSSTDWSTFNNKESALTFSAPFSRTTNTVSIPAASSVSNGYLSSSDWLTFNNKMGSALTSGQIFVGNATNTATGVAMSGDATLSNTGALTLKNTGTAGTYAKVTTDAQGRVTAGSALSSSDIPSLDASKVTTGTFTSSQIPALDWSKITSGKPTTLSGYGITDLIVSNGGNTPSIETGLDGLKSAAGTAGRLYIAKDTFKIYRDNGTSWDVIASQSGSGGTVTSVTGSGPISVLNGTTTPIILIDKANSTTTGVLSSWDWYNFNNKMDSFLTSGQIFVGNATNTAARVAMSGDATLSNAGELTLKNTGVAGTYAKVTTDAQGRVTAGSALSASDIPFFLNASGFLGDVYLSQNQAATADWNNSSYRLIIESTFWTGDKSKTDSYMITNTIGSGANPYSTLWFTHINPANSNEGRFYFDGNVGIGTSAPTAKLEIQNTLGTTLKVVDGKQGAGKILTSDASGNASWQAAPAASSFTGSLAGDVTGTQSATSIAASTVTGKALTGFVSGAGTVSATDTILSGIQKLDGNIATKAPLASPALTGAPTAPTAAASTNTTQIATTAFVLGQASSTSPAMDGTAAVGTGTTFARGDHVHPTDSSRAPAASPTFTGSVTMPGTGIWNSSGNVGINTSTPTAKLEIQGTSGTTLKVVDGNQGAGKVLTSDADGNASWAAAAAAGGFAGTVNITITPYTISSSQNGITFTYSNGAAGTINLPALSGLSDGFQVTIVRDVANSLTLTPSGADSFPSGITSIEMQGKNLQSVTLTKLGSKWRMINKTDDCLVGQACWGTGMLYVGTMDGHQYFTTPGGCSGTYSAPTCPTSKGSTDNFFSQWSSAATTSGTIAGNTLTVQSSPNADYGKPQADALATNYTDTYAAKYCKNLNFAGYTDWYLPARLELNLLYQNKVDIGGMQPSGSYWASTENNNSSAWYFGVGSGYLSTTTKGGNNYVRCVRRF